MAAGSLRGRKTQRWTKRAFDLALSLPALFALSPLFLAVAVVLKLDSPGPVFHRGERVGRGGKPFSMLKFRSMIVGAANIGPQRTMEHDARVTRVGRLLRRWKLDELPQLINVVRGEMSLVGPRPESPYYARHFTLEQRRVLDVRPGITGPAQIAFAREEEYAIGNDPDESYLRQILPRKLALDIAYLERASIVTDVRILLVTLLSLLPWLNNKDTRI